MKGGKKGHSCDYPVAKVKGGSTRAVAHKPKKLVKTRVNRKRRY